MDNPRVFSPTSLSAIAELNKYLFDERSEEDRQRLLARGHE